MLGVKWTTLIWEFLAALPMSPSTSSRRPAMRVAPQNKVPKTSTTNGSKAQAREERTGTPRQYPYGWESCTRLEIERCSIMTPLGFPVLPLVNLFEIIRDYREERGGEIDTT